MKFKSIIVDDEKHCRVTLLKSIEWYCPEVEVVGEFSDVDSAAQFLKSNKIDLLFLDIEMPEKNGFDLLYSLGKIDFAIIFVTAYDEFAFDAFKVNASSYLLKPVDKDELRAAIDKLNHNKKDSLQQEFIIELYQMMKKKDSSFNKVAIPTQESIEFVNLSSIIRCEANGNYTHIFVENRKPLFVAKTLKQIEEILSDSNMFFRPHNSHIVSLQFLKSYKKGSGGSLEMEDGAVIPVSRSRKEALNELI